MKIIWNDEQQKILEKMNLPFDFRSDLSDDEMNDLYEITPDYMEFPDGEPTKECLIVESIMDALIPPMKERGLLAKQPRD